MNKTLFDLTGRVAVVLGGSSGLGKAITIGLAAHGADVIPASRRAEVLVSVCDEIRQLGRKTLEASVDVSVRDTVQQLRDNVVKSFGRIDILVNAAGFTNRKPTLDIRDDEWSGIFETNLQGVLHGCQVFYGDLKSSGVGRIINIASLGSYVAFQEVAAYCASKAAVLSLTRSLAIEWAKDRICVNAIAPGVFPTELNMKLLSGTERGREILLRTPMNRFGDPKEVVGAAVLLASDGASFITGHCIAVDGGFLASGVNS
ncbi:MAG TPA: glucose 1-dehydrogenase [Bryobacteraceae bacterium]|nr:glucose 1-dehydrogenase [Bryobacteraceae bacterium]